VITQKTYPVIAKRPTNKENK